MLERGEIQDEGGLGGMVRTQALRQLCAMNPSSALVVHSEALRLCRMPGLAVALILDFGVDSSGKRLPGTLSILCTHSEHEYEMTRQGKELNCHQQIFCVCYFREVKGTEEQVHRKRFIFFSLKTPA